MGGKGNLVILEGPIGQSSQIERREGNYKAIAEYGTNVNVLEIRTANWSRAEALNLMENWLSAHGTNINGIIGQNDEMALGAIQAIKSAGLDPNDFVVVGIDGVSDALQSVENEEMLTSILQDAVGQGQGSLDILLAQLEGDSYVPQAKVWESIEFGDDIQSDYKTPWIPVDTNNAQSVMTERAELTKR